MTQDEIDIMWQQAMQESIKDGEMFTRYHFAEMIAERALADPMREVQRLGQEIEQCNYPDCKCPTEDPCLKGLAQPEQEPVPTLEDLEQEIYQNTRNFISRDVMEWMLRRYYTTPPQRTEQEPVAVVDVHEFYDNCANFSLLQKLPKGKHTLYTHPPQRKPLTDEEAFKLVEQDNRMEEYVEAAVRLIRRTEAAHGIKENQ